MVNYNFWDNKYYIKKSAATFYPEGRAELSVDLKQLTILSAETSFF